MAPEPDQIARAALGGLPNGLGALTSLAWLLLGERLTWIQGAGIACALIAVVLLSQEAAPPPA